MYIKQRIDLFALETLFKLVELNFEFCILGAEARAKFCLDPAQPKLLTLTKPPKIIYFILDAAAKVIFCLDPAPSSCTGATGSRPTARTPGRA